MSITGIIIAAAIVKGEAEVGGCPVGGAPVAAKVGEIMGVEAGAQVHHINTAIISELNGGRLW